MADRADWVTWKPRGVIRGASSLGLSNPRASKAHWASPDGGPCICGIWVPEDFDAIITVDRSVSRCKRCLRALAGFERAQLEIDRDRDEQDVEAREIKAEIGRM